MLESSGKIFAKIERKDTSKIEWKDTSKNPTQPADDRVVEDPKVGNPMFARLFFSSRKGWS